MRSAADGPSEHDPMDLGDTRMSFDALTISGFVAAILCGGFLIALIRRDDSDARRQSRITGAERTNGADSRS
jgi:hypothetical protein